MKELRSEQVKELRSEEVKEGGSERVKEVVRENGGRLFGLLKMTRCTTQ